MTRPASERLRELDERMTAGPWVPRHVLKNVGEGTNVGRVTGHRVEAEQIAALRNALPALTAAIEAAEDVNTIYRSFHDTSPDRVLDRALAALSTALTEGDA